MKQLWQGFCIAFSMYSAVPMPQVDWDEDSMRYALCFFPLVGVLIGLVMALWLWVCAKVAIGPLLMAAGGVALPLLITGGIHVDGFCDTIDALSSHASKERKLEILKDSHIGAFALIGCLVYFVLALGLWSELIVTTDVVWCLAIGYVFARALSGFSIASFICAKDSGLARTFADGAVKSRVRITMLVYMIVCAGLLLWLNWLFALLMIFGGLVCFIYYRVMAYHLFGGITGDLAGYFLQICELAMLLAIIIGEKVL